MVLGIAAGFIIRPVMSQDNQRQAMAVSGAGASLVPTQFGGGIAKAGAKSLPAPPEPFSIVVNGHTEISTVTVKRGETAQIDVLVSPKMLGITGNVYVQSVLPVCGTSNLHIDCIPQGITASISENTVSAAKHLVLTVNAAQDMPTGTYAYEVVSDTMMNLPDQSSPVKVGSITTFGIQVT
ncbi:hypothetical protein [Nitrososphaera viennensis]|uniref:hypothetical protein n=1 Tax=Nitrososphaera viennensis TaxID=1034015 RepID=UPI00130D60B5|nr:hypothetical protein [Nitrososphaera viennensis]